MDEMPKVQYSLGIKEKGIYSKKLGEFMANRWHVEWLKEGAKPWNRRRRKVFFQPDLSGLDFREILPVDYRTAPHARRFFEGINLSNSNLKNANLSNLNFRNAKFSSSNLEQAKLDATNFTNARFEDANLSNATVANAILDEARFINTALENINFETVEVSSTSFIKTPLSDTQIANLKDNGTIVIAASMSEYRAIFRSEVSYSGQPYLEPTRTPAEKDSKYDVFYGTNREPVYEQGRLIGFSGKRDELLHYGICEVVIPQSHEIGRLGTSLWKQVVKGRNEKIRMHQIIGLNPDLYWEHIKVLHQKMRVKERPTIFIHGFNNSFEASVTRAAQIGRDLGIGQGIGLFSWPSKGKLYKYAADAATADVSKYLLADYIQNFIRAYENGGVNIIAHSMGCRCLIGALEVLRKDREHILKSINQIILAAADIDQSHMDNFGNAATHYCTRTTSYVANQDRALKISSWLHNFPRVGVTPPTYILENMDTVIVNGAALGVLGHGYVSSNRNVLADMFALSSNNTPPSERFSIESVATENCWRIRP